MKVKVLKRKGKALKEFRKREWEHVDLEHWGRPTKWEEKTYFIKALEEDKIVGFLEMTIQAGVAKVRDLIIAQDARRKGIGKELMSEAERLAKKRKAHKLYLITGEGWTAEKFYKSLGYKKVGLLKKHSFSHNFVQFSKLL